MKELQDMMRNIRRFGKDFGMKINTEKTNVIIISRKKEPVNVKYRREGL